MLTYAGFGVRDIAAPTPRPPGREIEIHLTWQHGARFIWGFDGAKFSSADPIELKLGERVRFILVNGHHDVASDSSARTMERAAPRMPTANCGPTKHTINVKPGERLSYLVSADTPGRWAFHCHLLYHMETGMFRTVVVS